jgi:lipoprotein-anchoring transpeptidase ErfK/SrfK
MRKFTYIRLIAAAVAVVSVCAPATASAAAADPNLQAAQLIMTKFGIPTGPVDGKFGPQTARGFCAFRQIVPGSRPHRGTYSGGTLQRLNEYNARYRSLRDIPAPTRSGQSTYVLVNETCQVLIYVENGRYVKVMPVSTGKSGYNTPNGEYSLGYTQRGWSCSTAYPEGCGTHQEGRFAAAHGSHGNMYNKRRFTGAYYIHGSTSVPTYPASHGCIRVTVGDSDWLYDHVGNGPKPKLIVTGAY